MPEDPKRIGRGAGQLTARPGPSDARFALSRRRERRETWHKQAQNSSRKRYLN